MRLELLGASVEVPDEWDLTDTAALEPADGDAFRASAVLSAEPLGDVDFSTWQDTADAAAPNVLTDFRLIDREHVTVAGRVTTTGANPFDRFLSDDETARVAAFDEYDAALAFTLGLASADDEWRMAGLTGPRGSWLLEGTDGDPA